MLDDVLLALTEIYVYFHISLSNKPEIVLLLHCAFPFNNLLDDIINALLIVS